MTEPVRYLATIPSPTQGVWNIGPFPLRAYALFILLGIVAACWITEWRLRQRGAPKWLVLDVAIWAVPFGLVGGRLYHVITSPDDYFGTGGNPMRAFAIWEGGLGIWGAIALGGVGAWIALPPARRADHHVRRRGRRRHTGGAGDRPTRELVQQRAVRLADRTCRGV